MAARLVAEVTASVLFVGISAYLLRRVRNLERQLVSAAKEQHKALSAVTQRLDAVVEVARTVEVAPRVPSRAPSVSAQSSVREQLAWESMSARSTATSAADDTSGYKTADEDPIDEVDGRPVATLVATPATAATPGVGAGEGSPVRVDDWAARSAIGDSSWSCIDGGASEGGGGTAASGGGGAASTASVLEAEEAAARAAAEASILQKVDAMYKQQEYEAAAELLAGSEQTVEVLWRRCRVLKELADAAKLRGQTKQCEAMLREGQRFVASALAADASHYAVHKWYAIAVSSTSSYDGTKAQIEQSFVVREHFAKACELNPLDATSRHLLGLWYFEVASLSWGTRKLAAAIFASPPHGTYEEALAHFQLAEGIEPGFYLRNRLYLAKCQKELRDKPSAKQWAAAALELPVANHDDRTAAAEAKALLGSL